MFCVLINQGRCEVFGSWTVVVTNGITHMTMKLVFFDGFSFGVRSLFIDLGFLTVCTL